MATTKSDEAPSKKLEAMIEAARRANRDALHGPPHLRAGRFRDSPNGERRGGVDRVAETGAAPDGNAQRR